MRLLNLIKNPVLRNKTNYKVSNPVGDIVEEIREQDIVGLVGGNFERISAITEVTAWGAVENEKLTQRYNCGAIITVSAKCQLNTSGPC
ncbi:plantaricin C family lantibiotic [Clostridium saccharobutylicum]|uniref:Uncharacterized protein n=1 Tax=Clostridium saccharobutylicum DSM 13864 TaxID=1345695 RepID=U5N0G4_CLOSA|nr:plantaricin C family lantibiotic [Clostridium saccharobutylicum]AGX45391.1 hypothetical protein CLSA_c44540 [Clostridium saccharobutylicum DSM 13864]AQR92665.1 hypothetical protein CLOSC_44180 [Clostridium saccharobutylicum]AQS02567.1 hypothetical protein CSACC_44230 [Clostridium saccharobutylicum]AQS12172.1 hypothetical protein CLOBY_43550 [Clostridium saccharobutylicum]AQS16550.1 hypothetical protein CLOSACC_44230 [Clostridium saccharobutylicum]